MPTQDIFSQPIDKSALTLARAIALKESGNGGMTPNYNAIGDGGTSKGAGQWQPGNFEAAAQKYGLDPKDFSPENQDKVLYAEVVSGKKAKLTPEQIAAAHNAGEGKLANDAWKQNVGDTVINGKKIHYDTPAYVAGVQDYYKKLYGQAVSKGQVDSGGFVTSADVPNVSSQDASATPKKPGFLQSLAQGVTKPFLQVGSSVGALAQEAMGNDAGAQNITDNGVDYGYFGNAKPVGAGFDASKGIVDNAAPLASAAGTGAQIGLDVATGMGAKSLIGSLMSKATAVEAAGPILEDYTGVSSSIFNTLSATEKLNAIQEGIESAANATDKVILKNAFEELAPKVLTENGIGSFSEIHPILAKALGLSGGALKSLLKLGAIGAGLGTAGSLMDRLVPRK